MERDRAIPKFDRDFFGSGLPFSRIGDGELGGKAKGLIFIRDTLSRDFAHERFPGSEIRIPSTVVIATDVFDAFVDRNELGELAWSEESDVRIARAFQQASFPAEMVGDLRALVESVRTPLAIRSSSLLEDALDRPFAGVYETKMTPNNQPSPSDRFNKLVEAIKFVYASTFFQSAKMYGRATGLDLSREKMAVIIQEVVGSRHWDRFYPTLAAVGRTYNYYASGSASPEEGVMSLALGLGKTIVDGGSCWTYSPAYPAVPAPYGSVRDLLRYSQSRFWAVNMGKPPAFDPIQETEFLVEGGLEDAELDGSLAAVASTYDAASDRLVLGMKTAGPRVVDFAPLLRRRDSEFNDVIAQVLSVCKGALGGDAEVEMAIDLRRDQKTLFGFLQMRPMFVSSEQVDVSAEELASPRAILTSRTVVGNGVRRDISDLVYLNPDTFRPEETPRIAAEVDRINRSLVEQSRPYLLIGFGRWGSTDPWGGIPVVWSQISGARVIVEASRADFRAEPSQGSHFFHNVSSLRILYMSLSETESARLDWEWLAGQETVEETEHVRHVSIAQPLSVKIDGKNRLGGVWRS